MHWLKIVEWEQVHAHLKKAEVGCLIIYKYENDEFELNKIDLVQDYFTSGTLEDLIEYALSTLVYTWNIDLETIIQLTKIQKKLKIGLL